MTGERRVDQFTITYIRTCTLLVNIGGKLLVTDPWFSMRMRFLPALVRPGIPLQAMPQPDLILCSHLHPDHFEKRAVAALSGPHTVLVGPPGTARFLPRNVKGSLEEMSPGTALKVHGLDLHAFPMKHTHPPPEENGYLVKAAHCSFFFGGDAAYSDVFSAVGRNHTVDAALLPVGGSLIMGRRTVMDPAEAIRAAGDLGAPVMIPTHRGGDWLPMPPLSRHPGKLSTTLELARKTSPELTVLALEPGRTAVVRKETPDSVAAGEIIQD